MKLCAFSQCGGGNQVTLGAFSQCGGGNQDKHFRIEIKNVGQPKFKHWHFGHGYNQNAWSYST